MSLVFCLRSYEFPSTVYHQKSITLLYCPYWRVENNLEQLQLMAWVLFCWATINTNLWLLSHSLSATMGGNREVAHHLLRSGANINTRDKDGKTALMIAVINGHSQLVDLLLSKSADVTVQNEVRTKTLLLQGESGLWNTLSLQLHFSPRLYDKILTSIS